jgi:5-methylcytosine-specific restriction protein A
MPSAAPRPCTYPGCKALVKGGSRCEQHRQQLQREQDARRGSARDRGYTGAWERARAAYLRKHPLCKHCGEAGRIEPATVVDHIKPHRGDRALFWDSANWQPLCKPHHDAKTAREDGGFGRTPGGGAKV